MAANYFNDLIIIDDDDDGDGDDDVGKQTVFKREIVEEKNYKQGERKKCTDLNKDKKRSQISNSKKNVSSSYLKHGKPNSAGNTKLVGQNKSPAMVRAEHIRLSLGTESLSFLKLMVKSHVVSSFCMSIPSWFKPHLPTDETMITLEDESEERFEVKYIPKWMGMSRGWKNFADSHQLRERDVLVFHLDEPAKFKVYIVRANDSTGVNVNPSTLNPDSRAKENEQGEILCSETSDDADITPNIGLKQKTIKPLASISQKKNKRVLLGHQINRSETDDGNLNSEFSSCSRSSKPTDPCKGLKTFEDFKTTVNDLCEEADIDESMLKKYYELCNCKNTILHDQVLSGLNSKLVAGIIRETVNIAEAMKASTFTTSREELEQWENSLKSFKLLGMNVGFLLNRVSQLLRVGVGNEGSRFEDEMKKLEVKRVELKEAYEKVGGDLKKLMAKADKQQLEFQQVVNSPW